MEKTLRSVLSVVLPVALAVPATAQETTAQESAATVPDTVTLGQALDLTLQLEPSIRLAREEVARRAGVYDEEGGAFERTVFVQSFLESQRGQLLERQILAEGNKRRLFRILSDRFEEIAADLQQQLDDRGIAFLTDCEGLTITINQTTICSTDEQRLLAEGTLDLVDSLIGQNEGTAFGDDLTRLRDQYLLVKQDVTANVIKELRQQALGARGGLRDLGLIPELEKESRLGLDLRYQIPLRSGIVITPGLLLEGEEDNFVGKDADPALGGKGVPNAFTAIAGVIFDFPLGSGRGATAVTAAERAAERELEAARGRLRHTISESLLGTTVVYWRLAAAQERQVLLERSAETQERLSEIARELVDGGELPEADLPRVEARVAAARSAVASARRGVVRARWELARRMGVPIAGADDAPRAKDPLPEVDGEGPSADLALRELGATAWKNRQDLAASHELEKAAAALLEGAENDLRHRWDLSLTVAWSGLYESFDTEFWNPKGLGEALADDQAGPSVQLRLTYDVRVGNRASRGRLLQAQALRYKSEVTAADLSRRVEASSVEVFGALERSAAEVGRLKTAVELYRDTLDAEVERFESGSSTLIDTILTEERWTLARLDLLGAHERYLTLVTTLGFETGTLVEFDGDTRVAAIHPLADGI